MNALNITKKANRQINKFPKADAQAIYAALENLREWPNCGNVKSLTNREDYRLRIGDFRAFFTVTGNTINITEVKRRNEHTY
jgi:mRNA-degrading endonuclease RelE of RelBE toxin-antitoxin system